MSSPGDGTPPLNNGSWFYIFGDANPPNAVNPNCTATFNYAGLNPVTFIVSEEYNGQVCTDTITKDVQVDSAVSPPCPCLLYTSPSPRDATLSRMPSSA